ncbi:MAG: carboxypeptidase regulatory-like domain-containing protein [Verrucomicrobiaceae bacterium]|nr:carboxypeptidase regulatory-like domain-containing protein [Verrucomicrobiaceae bacterium]
MRRTLLVYLFLGMQAAVFAGGTVQGTLVLEAMKPPPARAGYVAPATKKPVEKPDMAPAIVYLERDDEQYPPLRTGEVVNIRQEGYQFRPSMAAVQAGGRVNFPNMDDEFHNVVSYTRPNAFDLGRFRKEEGPRGELFKHPGVVKIYCDIHAHMRCFLLVLKTPWFVTTDAAGKFTLKNIPPGEYWLRAFQPSEKLLQQRITVTEGKTTTVHLTR